MLHCHQLDGEFALTAKKEKTSSNAVTIQRVPCQLSTTLVIQLRQIVRTVGPIVSDICWSLAWKLPDQVPTKYARMI